MKKLDGKKFGAMTFGVALALAAFGQAPAMAGPFGAAAAIKDQSALPLVDVQARRVRPAGRPVGRPVARNRGRNGAAVAGALIGAAIVGGAIIANSNQRRRVYVDDGYYNGGDPYYGAPTGYAVPSPYYGGGYYQQPQPVYRQPRYAPAPRTYIGGGQPGPYTLNNQGGEGGSRYNNNGEPLPPAGSYYSQPTYQQRGSHRGRTYRDPAGGGLLR